MLSDAKCCAMPRERQDHDGMLPVLLHTPRVQSETGFPKPGSIHHCRFESIEIDKLDSFDWTVNLPGDFFQRLASLAVNDPHIAVRIEDDRSSPLIWGEAGSLRFLFLQMCIRDQHDRCRELWLKFNEYDRQTFRAIYRSGPPSPDFFLDLMVEQESTWKEMTDSDMASDVIVYGRPLEVYKQRRSRASNCDCVS